MEIISLYEWKQYILNKNKLPKKKQELIAYRIITDSNTRLYYHSLQKLHKEGKLENLHNQIEKRFLKNLNEWGPKQAHIKSTLSKLGVYRITGIAACLLVIILGSSLYFQLSENTSFIAKSENDNDLPNPIKKELKDQIKGSQGTWVKAESSTLTKKNILNVYEVLSEANLYDLRKISIKGRIVSIRQGFYLLEDIYQPSSKIRIITNSKWSNEDTVTVTGIFSEKDSTIKME